MPIEVLAGTLSNAAAGEASQPAAAATGFTNSLDRLISATESRNAEANQAVGRMLEGSGDVHDAMIALQRAELSLQMTVQVRNKLVQAYQDIMRMPV